MNIYLVISFILLLLPALARKTTGYRSFLTSDLYVFGL